MKNNKYIIAIIFVLLLLVISVVEYKLVAWQETSIPSPSAALINNKEDSVSDKDGKEISQEEIRELSIKEKAEKKLIAESFNSCGESAPILVPGYIKAIKEASIVVTVNQKGYDEDKEIKITSTTSFVKAEVKKDNTASNEKIIGFEDLEKGANVVVKAVADKDNIFSAEQIKYLIFE